MFTLEMAGGDCIDNVVATSVVVLREAHVRCVGVRCANGSAEAFEISRSVLESKGLRLKYQLRGDEERCLERAASLLEEKLAGWNALGASSEFAPFDRAQVRQVSIILDDSTEKLSIDIAENEVINSLFACSRSGARLVVLVSNGKTQQRLLSAPVGHVVRVELT